MEQFASCWEGLEDPRTGNAALHDFHELLFIALCTVLCGGQNAVDMAEWVKAKEGFLRGFLKLKHGLPSHDTFSRLFRMLDPDQFRAAFQRFMMTFAQQCQGVVAIDGKVLRRSFDRASRKSPLHMVSAWGCEQRMVLAQVATDAKSNEITAVPKLLAMLSLTGTIVTADALNCQRSIAEQIVNQGGNYALALKENQPTLHADVVLLLDDPACQSTRQSRTSMPGMAVSKRALPAYPPISMRCETCISWPGLKAVGKVHRVRETAEKTTDRNRLLSAEHAPVPGTLQRGCPFALGCREQSALAPRRRDERGSSKDPARQRAAQYGCATAHGAECLAEGPNKGLTARQVQARGVE